MAQVYPGRFTAEIEGPFVVWACDSIVSTEHVAAILAVADGADAVLSLLDVAPDLVSRSAAVVLDDDLVTRIVEKPDPRDAPSSTVSLPHYLFDYRALDLLQTVERSPRGEFELPDVIQGLIDGGSRVVGVKAGSRFQVSSPNDLLVLNRDLLKEELGLRNRGLARPGEDVTWIEPVFVEQGVVVPDGCEIGPEVYLERGCQIGRDARIRRSIILRDGRVGDGETIEDEVLAGASVDSRSGPSR